MDDQRFPTNVRLIGMLHKDKIKMFMTSVVWSDKNEVIIYRSYQDFKRLHKQLKKKYPSPAPLSKSVRILPRFRDVKKTFQKKGSSKSVYRVKALEKYSTELIQGDPSVTQTSEVIQFFQPKAHDLEPDFAKNSIIIVPSDDLAEMQGDGSAYPQAKRLSMGNVTQPFLTQTYRAVAPYETKDTKNRPFKVDVDETLDVLIKDQKGWWLVENEKKCLAWFPAPYLEPCEGEEEEDDDDFEEASYESTLYCAARNYVSKKRDEVSVNIGSVVEVLRKSDDGWWLIRYNGRVGYVPSMYLQPYNHPYMGLQKKFHNSTFTLSPATPLSDSRDLSWGAPRGHSRSMENLLEPSHVRGYPVPDVTSAAAAAAGATASSADSDRTEVESRKSSVSTSSSDDTDTDLSFSPSGSLSGAEGEQEEALVRGSSLGATSSSSSGQVSPSNSNNSVSSGTPTTITTSSSPTSPSAVAPPRVPPRPQAQEIFARCTTYTRKAAMASRARLLPQQTEIQTR